VPPKRKIDLPDHVRDAVLDDVKLSQDISLSATENFKIRIYLAVQQGVSTYEIAERLGVSQSVVSKWSREGEQTRSRRLGGDPDRPAELATNGV
jgi:transposase-like protein